jgi:predicted TIM-barrel fold metal-dependent hydrolase
MRELFRLKFGVLSFCYLCFNCKLSFLLILVLDFFVLNFGLRLHHEVNVMKSFFSARIAQNVVFSSLMLGAYQMSFAQSEALTHTYKGQSVEVIDVHQHSGKFENMGKLGQEFLLRTLPDFLPEFLKRGIFSTAAKFLQAPYGQFIGIQSECTKAKLSKCGLMALYAPETWGTATNNEMLENLADKRNKTPGKTQFFAYASLPVNDWETKGTEHLNTLRTALSTGKFSAIKLAFIHTYVQLDDPKFDPIYEIAQEFNVPVYHHVGSTPLQPVESIPAEKQEQFVRSFNPIYLEPVLQKFPKVNFIMGHMGFDFNKEGFDFTEEVYNLATKYPNVLLEISAFGRASYDADGIYMDSALRNLKERNLISQTIYGSDGPGFPGASKSYVESTLLSLERVGYTFEEAQSVLSGNTKKFFRLD